MTEPIDPRDGGYGEIGCLLIVPSTVIGAVAAIVLELLSPTGVEWLSLIAGFAAGWAVPFAVMDPLLEALGRLKVQRRLAEPIFLIVAAVLPGAVTIGVSLATAALLG